MLAPIPPKAKVSLGSRERRRADRSTPWLPLDRAAFTAAFSHVGPRSLTFARRPCPRTDGPVVRESVLLAPRHEITHRLGVGPACVRIADRRSEELDEPFDGLRARCSDERGRVPWDAWKIPEGGYTSLGALSISGGLWSESQP